MSLHVFCPPVRAHQNTQSTCCCAATPLAHYRTAPPVKYFAPLDLDVTYWQDEWFQEAEDVLVCLV